MGYHELTFQTDGDIATIALTRPEKRNAISVQMIADLMSALEQAETGSARVVLLTGSGKAFCSGLDLDEVLALARHSLPKHLEDARRLSKMFYRLYSFPKPIIAAVNGPAIAGGCGIATLADITLAVPEAKFGYPEVKIGFIPALVSVFLRRQIGDKKARELLLTGRVFDAQEALRLGLINEIVSAERLMDRAHEIATDILSSNPTSVRETKRILHIHDEKEVRLELELAIEASADIRMTEDFHEGVSAFLEKRAPRWQKRLGKLSST